MASSIHDLPGNHTAFVIIHAHAAATATESIPIFVAPFACKLMSVTVTPAAAATGDNTNRTNINLQNGGTAGTGTTELGNLDYATGTDAAVGVPQTVYSSTTGTALAAGSVLKAVYEKVGNGVALGANLVTITYRGN
jgi:hypothetical protein